MIFGEAAEFAIETYHSPSAPEWAGFGRMCITISGVRIGVIRENHCSLFHSINRLRKLYATIETLWDESFAGLSDAEIFALLDEALYVGIESGWERYGRFDFLTNTGEQFDDAKTFIVCRPNGRVHVLYQLHAETPGAASCSVQSFRRVAESVAFWFDEQVRSTAPPYFPIEPIIPQ